MKKIALALLLSVNVFNAQTAADLFTENNVKISWLGIDYSHVKLIGDFNKSSETGQNNPQEIRDRLFPDINDLVLLEPKKYDLNTMLRKESIISDIGNISSINAKSNFGKMESTASPNYTQADIRTFVKEYNTSGKSGIGVLFIVETLNKTAQESYVHFVAIDMKTKAVLIQQRLLTRPKGFGLRNYWAGAICYAMKDITNVRFFEWKSTYL